MSSERLVTNFFCPVCGRITWSGDEHNCTPPPYKPEGGTWIEGDVMQELYAACQAVLKYMNCRVADYDSRHGDGAFWRGAEPADRKLYDQVVDALDKVKGCTL